MTAAKRAKLKPPFAYRDSETGILVYVESDGRHVAAIDADGKILWHRDVVAEEGLRPTRADVKLAIHGIHKPFAWMLEHMKEKGANGKYVGVGFTNREFGLLDEHSGAYTSLGND